MRGRNRSCFLKLFMLFPVKTYPHLHSHANFQTFKLSNFQTFKPLKPLKLSNLSQFFFHDLFASHHVIAPKLIDDLMERRTFRKRRNKRIGTVFCKLLDGIAILHVEHGLGGVGIGHRQNRPAPGTGRSRRIHA